MTEGFVYASALWFLTTWLLIAILGISVEKRCDEILRLLREKKEKP